MRGKQKQAWKCQSYASLKLQPTHLLTLITYQIYWCIQKSINYLQTQHDTAPELAGKAEATLHWGGLNGSHLGSDYADAVLTILIMLM